MGNIFAQRIEGFGTSIFSEITALAVQYNAVNLGQGFPDFASPDFIKRAAAAAIDGNMNQYAPSAGLVHLRQVVAGEWERRYNHAVDPDQEVTVTSGATEALSAIMQALLNPGDEAIVFEPAYDAYIPDIVMAGGNPLPVRLQPPDWHFDPEQLRQAFARRPKLILVNTPHNPTGKVFSRNELALIAELCQEYNVVAITDEVYDRLVYTPAEHIPLATLPGMWERTLTINSAGKTFSVTGWKIGYAVGPAVLNQALRQAHQWVTFATATPFQQATAVALEQAAANGYYEQTLNEYNERRLHLQRILDAAGLTPLTVQGSYFTISDIGKCGFTNDRSFCHYLIRETGVAAIPISAFYIDPTTAPALIRFCFAKKRETLDAVGERLQRLART